MKGKELTLKLLDAGRIEAMEITMRLKDKGNPKRGDLLSPSLSEEAKTAVWVYRQFLASTGIPFLPDAEIDTAYEKVGVAWNDLFAALAPSLPDGTYRNLVATWHIAHDALGAILRHEPKPAQSAEAFANYSAALESAAGEFMTTDPISAIQSQLGTMHRDLKSGIGLMHVIHKKIDPNFRYNGVEKAGNLSKQTQIRAAITFSWDEQFEIARPSSKQENRGKRTIADLARTVWEPNEWKWKYDKDGYKTCKSYEVALRAQFARNPASFRLLDDEQADQSSNL